MKKFLKLIFIIFLLVILGMISLYNAIFGSISVNLKNITSTEKNDILTIIGVDNIELEKLEIPFASLSKLGVMISLFPRA